MPPSKLNQILMSIPLVAVLGCGGNTSRNGPDPSQGDVSTGGAETGGVSSGAVSATGGGPGGTVGAGGHIDGSGGGELTTGGQAGSAGSTSQGGTGGTEPPPYLFDILTLERHPADGYCLQPGNIVRGAVLYGETGEYGMAGTVFREWDESRPNACWGIESPDCVISEQFDLILTAAQVAELAALLEVLPEDRCELDEMRECDPCLITTLVVNGTTYSDYCCGAQLSAGYSEAFQPLVNFLDGLAA